MNQTEMMEREGWWSVARAANSAGVSAQTVYRWIRMGQVEHAKSGSRWYVSKASLIVRLGPVAARAAGLISDDADA